MISLVRKQKTSPNAIENGKAGRARRKMAKNIKVKHNPIRMATKQAKVVFQSPYELAFPTKMEQKMKSPSPNLIPRSSSDSNPGWG